MSRATDGQSLEQQVRDMLERAGVYDREVGQEFTSGDLAELANVLRDALRFRALDTPEIDNFLEAVRNEALHQRTRDVEDDRKTPANWYWTLGYLMGKALHDVGGKRRHHIITSAALLLNWHSQESGQYAQPRGGAHVG